MKMIGALLITDEKNPDKIIEVHIKWTNDNGNDYEWQMSKPSVEMLNHYMESSNLSFDDKHHNAIIHKVAMKMSLINPLLIAAEPDAAIDVMHDLMTSELSRIQDIQTVETLKKRNRLN